MFRLKNAAPCLWGSLLAVALTLATPAVAQRDASIDAAMDAHVERGPDAGPAAVDPPACLAQDGAAGLHARDCPPLFGDASSSARHLARRQQTLESADQGEFCIELVHHTAWKQPRRAKLDGVELVATQHDARCPATALIDVDAAALALGCPSGIYSIHVDDSLGDSGQVLAIFDDVVLLEFAGELFYLSDRVSLRPDWRMTWQSRWSYAMPAAAPGRASAKKRARAGKRTKKRPQPRARKKRAQKR